MIPGTRWPDTAVGLAPGSMRYPVSKIKQRVIEHDTPYGPPASKCTTHISHTHVHTQEHGYGEIHEEIVPAVTTQHR